MSNYLRRLLTQNNAEAAAGLQPTAARLHASSPKITHWCYLPIHTKHYTLHRSGNLRWHFCTANNYVQADIYSGDETFAIASAFLAFGSHIAVTCKYE